MIEIERRDVARFRAAVRRCVVGRPRGLAPPVVLQQHKDGLTLSAHLEATALTLHLPTTRGPTERLVVPFALLAALEGPGGGNAQLETMEDGSIRCRWLDHGQTKEVSSPPPPPEAQASALPPVGKLQAVDASLLTALHACGQTASREPGGRLPLSRLQLRGQDGAVAGTDGRQLLLWRGYTFPFQDNLLIPAIPFFGGRELAGEQEVRLGRKEQHVVLAAGPWTIWLAIDDTSRYPDVMSVLPQSSRLAKLVLDDADAALLLQALQKELAAGDEEEGVVLDLGARPALRWPEGASGRRQPVPLVRSASTGPAIVVRLNPRFLARALELGFREVRCAAAEAPVLFRDEQRSFLIAPFSPTSAPVAASTNRQASPVSGPEPSPSEQGEEPMPADKAGGPPRDPSAADPVLDPLTEAEALRTVLAEAVRQTSRLILSLRQFQKQRRALNAAMSSLKHLRLGPWEEP